MCVSVGVTEWVIFNFQIWMVLWSTHNRQVFNKSFSRLAGACAAPGSSSTTILCFFYCTKKSKIWWRTSSEFLVLYYSILRRHGAHFFLLHHCSSHGMCFRVVKMKEMLKLCLFCDSGSRFHVSHDFGFVNLDINKVVLEDSGVYMCKAINLAGEAVSSASLKVKCESN